MDFKQWIDIANVTPQEWLAEATTASRYSVEVNFRSNKDETLDAFAKIALGYVSAALKQNGYHVKQVYEERPLRILISTRNWDDGEWVGVVLFNPSLDGGSFVIAKGFYNKDRRTASVQSHNKAKGSSAAEVAREVREMMYQLKEQPDRHKPTLKPIPLKRGPKR